ncbi:transglutaminaseTgpA domain-containing protein [Microbacterium gorillae]|uniref:transglutaminaseTgpA domain-containing protein n=1 Tax=Microbacterium gorillae TaxID=1231063 RepID=UPI000A56EEDB|nr:transglutaminaseTgpA domain-containing protein [Microbacterium gorillae]
MTYREPRAATTHRETAAATTRHEPGAATTRRRPRPDGRIAALTALAVSVSIAPLTTVLSGGGWEPVTVIAIVLVIVVGYLLRRTRLPRILVPIAQLLSVAALLMLLSGGTTTLFGVIPTPQTLPLFSGYATEAVQQIRAGVAPLAPTPALTTMLVAAFGVLAVAIDAVTAVARLPLAAGALLAVVCSIPAVFIPGPTAGVSVVVIMVLALLMARRGTVVRAEADDPDRVRRGGTLTAVVTGTVALLVAVLIAPAVPGGTAAGTGFARFTTVDASLDLGRDLRRPDATPVLTFRSDLTSAPYLRLTTVTDFTGRQWQPDESDKTALGVLALPVDGADHVSAQAHVGTVEVGDLSSQWAPVPYAATAVTGISGAWLARGDSRTISSETSDASGQHYGVDFLTLTPTLEQIEAAPATRSGVGADPAVSAIPAETPRIIADTAAEVTSSGKTDYDKLILLQSWFRDDFQYSLTAPIDDGFDGTGIAAMVAFLQKREGYCVHFASTFTLMARTLGMPARVVVGFLPGEATNDKVDDQTVYQVTSDQLHAWPEVYFTGIGWVPFEPTATLGTPTAFTPATNSTAGPEPTTGPAPAPTRSVKDDAANNPQPTAGSGTESGTVSPVVWIVPLVLLGLALLALVPALARIAIRARRRARARAGDAVSAWREVLAQALDLGLGVTSAETPRAFAERMSERRETATAPLRTLATAVERTSYAHPDADRPRVDLTAEMDAVRAAWRTMVDPADRRRAFLLPRSLFRRPLGVDTAEASRAPSRTG